MKQTTTLKNVLANFNFEGICSSEECHDIGNINDTIMVTYDCDGTEKKYVVQRINHDVFTNPVRLMDNMVAVTKHLAQKIELNGGDVERECLNLIKTKSGDYFHKTKDGNYYRAFMYIDGARTYMKVENEKHMYETGKALGRFQKYLSDFAADNLFEVIKDFHNTPKRYEDFKVALEKNLSGRAHIAKEEIDFINSRVSDLNKLVDLSNEGKIPLRVTHNDTKFNNIMIDNETGKAVCVIDLDTVMPGLSLYDFGDAIRSGCSSATEDEIDLSKVNFDMNLYKNFVKGLLEETKDTLVEEEVKNIAFSAKLITMELAMRFLTDYLNGDTYFKVNHESHNLERTRNQLKLAKDMENNMDKMDNLVIDILK
ncbi:MAG: phosphotransferase enzyme family protein [Sarcina sp.]